VTRPASSYRAARRNLADLSDARTRDEWSGAGPLRNAVKRKLRLPRPPWRGDPRTGPGRLSVFSRAYEHRSKYVPHQSQREGA
jgi:hypothetical protein